MLRTVNVIAGTTGGGGGGVTPTPTITPATAFAPSAATAATPNPDLIGQWLLNENTGSTTADSSGNGRTGTLVNNPTWTPGVEGSALLFDGADRYVNIPAAGALNPTSITISMWIELMTAYPAYNNTILEKGDENNDNRIRYINSGWQWITNGATNNLTSATQPALGVWEHWIFVGDSSGLKIYRNGVLDSSSTVPYVASASAGDLEIGGSGTFYDNAKVDDVNIFDRALYPTEIQQLYTTGSVDNAPRPGTCVLSPAEFDADRGTQIIFGPIATSTNGMIASFTLTNNSNCWVPISMTSYKMFVPDGTPTWLTTQQLFDSVPLITEIPPNTQRSLAVLLPDCMSQIDAWYGFAPAVLSDSGQYGYPNVPFIIAYAYGHGPLCQAATTTPVVNTPPVLTILGANPLTLTVNTVFTDPGATATDAQDGDLTSHIIASSTVSTTTIGTYSVSYTVTDSGGLTATSTRVVNVVAPVSPGANTAPVLTIIGANPLTIDVNTVFTDPGATAIDAQDGDLTSHIIASSTVSTTTVGAYTVTYTITDSGGLTATSTRVVNVVVPVIVPVGITSGGSLSQTSSGGGGYSSGTLPVASPSQPDSLNQFVTCPLLNSYLRYGYQNDPTEVVKLQAFLQRLEGYDVDVNGTFDQKTLIAVNSFQTKYLSAVMGPWGADHSSGYVYITTRKEINMISCNVAFVITPAEQTIIDAYKASQLIAPTPTTVTPAPIGIGAPAPVTPTAVVPLIGPEISTTTPDLGQNTGSILGIPVANAATVGSNIAGAAGATGVAVSSIFGRSWNFFTVLFSR